jgi:hypothetical protein
VSNYRSAELCCYFLIFPLSWLKACKPVIYGMAELVKEYFDLRRCKPDLKRLEHFCILLGINTLQKNQD